MYSVPSKVPIAMLRAKIIDPDHAAHQGFFATHFRQTAQILEVLSFFFRLQSYGSMYAEFQANCLGLAL